tara:strand:- start:501 stop:935 length:435 start_codon:yes stop_codon:yes gene_type:complete
MEASLKKKIINQIYSFNFLEKNSEKYKNKQANVLDVKKNWNIKKLFKNINKKKYDYLTISTKKIKKIIIFKIFFKFLTSSLLIYKNTYVFYEINSEVRGENIFPVWPRSYKELSFFQSFYFWIKKLGLIFLYSSKIQLILIKIK